MPVPSSGQINLEGIFSEMNEDDYAAQNIDGETNVSFTKLSNGTYNTINTTYGWTGSDNTSGETGSGITANPKKISEWRGYDHDESPPAFVWNTPVGGVAYAASGQYDALTREDDGSYADCDVEVKLTFNSNGSHTHETRDVAGSGGSTFQTGGSFSSSGGNPTILEARWIIVDGDITTDGGSTDKISIHINPGGTLSSASQDVRTGAQSNVTNHDFTGNWVTITPAVLGGAGANTQTHRLSLTAQSYSSSGDSVTLVTNASGDYVALELRANSDNNKIITLRSPNITNSVDLEATSYEPPDFSCLLPTMQVRHETKGLIPISSVVVGDNIETIADLNNRSAGKVYTRVTENVIHNRSGYWNVENGLKITNDHPVWLSDESSSAWVKVEDMRPDINRTYHEGAVDTHYVGTEAGHFYAYYENVTFENPGLKWIVSGNYSPETD